MTNKVNFKLWISTSKPPKISKDDPGIWRRILMPSRGGSKFQDFLCDYISAKALLRRAKTTRKYIVRRYK